MAITEKIEKSTTELIKQTKEDMHADSWLKKAKGHERRKNYKAALDAYLTFLEIKLHIIQTRPEYGVKSYLGLVKYYIKIAECYANLKHTNFEEKARDIENAAGYYIKSAEMFMELTDYVDAQRYYETAARCYEELKKYDTAAECYLKIAKMYNKLNDRVLAISSYINAAKSYDAIDNSDSYEKSVNSWLNVANLNLETGNNLGASSGYKKVGDSYKKMGKYQEALSYYLRSADIIAGTEHYTAIADIYNSIALDYEDLKEYENAIHYHMKSSDLNIKVHEEGASSSYRSIALCYEKLGKYDEAIPYYLKSCDIESKLKNYKNLVYCYNGMAKCYEELKEYKKSADTYFQSAEYASTADKNSTTAKEDYRKAASIYQRLADEGLANKDYAGVLGHYNKITECYDRINEYKESAETYCKYATIIKDVNYSEAIHAYREAAGRYAMSMDIKKAAYYYAKGGEYANSAKFYKEYAVSNKNNKFLAAEGYRMAANSYKKLKKLDDEREYFNKAVSHYIQYMQKLEYSEEKVNKGEIYKKIAECYNELDDTPNTKKNLEEALKFYDGAGMENERITINALLSKANAKLAMKTGEYSTAGKLLNDALNLFDESIKKGNFDEDYIEFLEKNKSEIPLLLGQIKLKPTLVLNVEQPAQLLAQGTFDLKGVISNKGDQDVYGVLILLSMPPAFQILKSPEVIEILKPNESKEISIQLNVSSAGEFKFTPLEVLYKDIGGNKYMKASNEISIVIQGAHGEYGKDTIGIEKGCSYLVEESIPEKSINMFRNIIGHEVSGLYISREHPDKVKSRFPSNVSVIWLSSSQGNKDVVNPLDLVELGHLVREFIDKNRNSIILFYGIEYLITQDGYEHVLKFIQSVNDTIVSSDSRLIISINPKALNPQQLTLLEREGKIL